VTRRKISVLLISLILLSVIIVKDLSLERKDNQKGSEKQTVSLNEHEIAEKVNKKIRSSFFENQGQMDNQEIIYYGSLPNGKIAFGESKVLLWADGMNDIITINFVGARKISPFGLDELITKSNYFLGDRGTFTNVKSFGAVLFRVAPGANPEDISIFCEGQEQLDIRKDSMTILKSGRRFVDEGLIALQDGIEIKSKFVIKGENTFGFKISNYDQSKFLVIDPLIYSTFVGGSDGDSANSIALDSYGNALVTGWTTSIDFPTTENAFNRTYSGGAYGDCFIFKLSVDGSSLIYSTFIGGNESDFGNSISLDEEGDVYVTGHTSSSDFPVTENAFNGTYGGSADCFVIKLSNNGSNLLHSTFIGGNDGEVGLSIALDDDGNAYVTGHTTSNNFPVTGNAFNSSYNGNWDCFVIKLSNNGSNLLYSSFVGGNSGDLGKCIAIDNDKNIYITGYTSSDDFPTTINAYDRSYNGGDFGGDCFVIKFSIDSPNLIYSTYLGGSNDDDVQSIALDNLNNAYITGYTTSDDFPTTLNAYDSTHQIGVVSDCFVCKLSCADSSLIYSTFIGGSWLDRALSITLDNERNAYVTGWTESSDFPTTANAYNRIHHGDHFDDSFVCELSENGSSLHYSTFIGGLSGDYSRSIILDNEKNIYVTGTTSSSDFPTTEGAYKRTCSGSSDCFVFKLSIENDPIPNTTPIGGLENGIIFSFVFVSMMVMVIYRRKRNNHNIFFYKK